MTMWEVGGSDHSFLRSKKRPHYEGTRPLRIVDLFSGCGGLTLGAAEACRAIGRRLQVVLAMEMQPGIRSVYDTNFRSSVQADRGDVAQRFNSKVGQRLSRIESSTQRECGAIDLLVGGPPCQGHSNLNNHTRRDDPKNALYMGMVRAAEVLAPSLLVIENVPEVTRDASGVVEHATARLERVGYSVYQGRFNLLSLGVPQSRIRHVLVASQNKLPPLRDAFELFTIKRPRTLSWAIGDLDCGDSLFDSPSRLSAENLKRWQHLEKNDEYDLPNSLRPSCHRDSTHRYKSMYGRLRWEQPAQTITTGFGSPGQGRYFHPAEPRTLTAHEAARLQFFPDWFNFGAAWNRDLLSKCIGNAVPAKLGFVLTAALLARDINAFARQSA